MLSKTVSYQSNYTTQIHLSSSNANKLLNGTKKSDVVFYFNNFLHPPRNTIELSISLVNASLPHSFYNINDTNNQIRINSTVFTFPIGNYTPTSFITAWTSLVGSGWTVTFSSFTNSFSFTPPVTTTATFNDSNINSIFPVIGLQKSEYYFLSSSAILTTGVVDFSGLRRVLIASPSFNIRNFNSNNSGSQNILASVPITNTQNGIIQYTNITQNKSVIFSNNLSLIEIQLLDEEGNLIDFNGCDWSLTLQFDNIVERMIDFRSLLDIYEKEFNSF
jgi:hypothetical protein